MNPKGLWYREIFKVSFFKNRIPHESHENQKKNHSIIIKKHKNIRIRCGNYKHHENNKFANENQEHHEKSRSPCEN